jgi:hypothetical protein
MADYSDFIMGEDEARKILQEVSGFYPLFEVLLKRYNDLITPAVFGVAWRFCQMQDGVCRASLRKLAGILNISEATVMRRLEDLCNDGYLIDTTPDLKNSPHVYADAGLVTMKSSLGVVETVSHRNSTKSVSARKATVSQGKATVSGSQLIKGSNKELNKEDIDSTTDAQIFQALEKLTGGLLRSDTPRIVDTWKEKHSFEKIMQAIELAAVKGRMPVTYVDSILIGWEANGYPKSREQQVQERKGMQPKSATVESAFDLIDRVLGVSHG